MSPTRDTAREGPPPEPSVHPHPPVSAGGQWDTDVIVVGGGHAGVEAALAAARLGSRVTLISFRLDLVAEMSCNPAIGGLGKGQIVREVDALGGAMARVADATGIQFRVLNTGKGAAVRAPRCQSDRHLYREQMTRLVAEIPGVELLEGGVAGLIVEDAGVPCVRGVRLEDGRCLRAPAVVLTTGTFLRAVMHTGDSRSSGGRQGERSAEGLSQDVARLALKLARLKTGTPPRLREGSLRWEAFEEQWGDERPRPFSLFTPTDTFPLLRQVPCHITHTTPATHAVIAENLHLSPMYSGRIQGVGPRYCPSIEDKVVRFADRDRHQIFVEPEGLETDVIYVNGISTSLPAAVQEAFVHTIPGLEQAEFVRHGYAVEYDFVQPSQLADTLAVRHVPGLFLAGQINGTSGYEEAAGQGLVAGANAALWVQDRAPFVLGRHEAYIGVMVDDLIVTSPSEPYRMFTSRAEYRLLLRSDNADRRLTARAAEIGLAQAGAAQRVAQKERALEHLRALLDSTAAGPGRTLTEHLRRPEIHFSDLVALRPELGLSELDEDVREAVEIEVKYAGYVARQEQTIARLARQESTAIPHDLDYSLLTGMGTEARTRLAELRPRTLGAASRIEGVRPPDVALLSIHLERRRRSHADDAEASRSAGG